MEDVVESICCNAHGEVFVGKKRTRERRGRNDGYWQEREKKIVGMWGTQQANQKELLTQLRCTTGEARKEIDLTEKEGGGECEIQEGKKQRRREEKMGD